MNYIKLPSRGRPGTRPYPLFLIAEGRPWPQEAGGFGAGTAAGRLDRLREGSNKEDTMDKIRGQHVVPKLHRAEDLGMVLEDADIARAFSERDAARERQRREDDLREQMLKDMDRQAERRQKGWDIFCDTGILAAGACLVGTLQQHSLAWLIAAAVFYIAARVGKEVQW